MLCLYVYAVNLNYGAVHCTALHCKEHFNVHYKRFHRIDPLGQFDLVVAMSMDKRIC